MTACLPRRGTPWKPARTGIDIGKVSTPYILTNVNGHFYLPISSKSLLYDLLELARKMAGYAGIRVVPYHEQHSIDGLAGATNRRLNEIRSPVTRYVADYVDGKEVKKRVERDHPQKGGEFDRYGNELVEKMREYASLGIYSVYLFAGPEDGTFVAGYSYHSVIRARDRLQFIPVRPIKKRVGLLKWAKVNPMEVIGTPLFFDIGRVTKKCSDRYYSNNIIYRRLHSPVICAPSDLRFPVLSPAHRQDRTHQKDCRQGTRGGHVWRLCRERLRGGNRRGLFWQRRCQLTPGCFTLSTIDRLASHSYVLGGTGTGKTTFLRNAIKAVETHHLKNKSDDDPCVIYFDVKDEDSKLIVSQCEKESFQGRNVRLIDVASDDFRLNPLELPVYGTGKYDRSGMMARKPSPTS